MEVYAELSSKIMKQIKNSGNFAVPYGVKMTRKKDSRACHFECDDDNAKEDLINFLDNHGIAWQDND